MDLRVAYQGIKGAYSYIAARYLFPEAELIGLNDFAPVYRSLVDEEVDAVVLPIENTVIGSIFEVYDLMFIHDDIQIVGELTLRVDHNLLSIPDKGEHLGSDRVVADDDPHSYLPQIQLEKNQIKQIYSHPKALEQCRVFIAQLEAKPMPWEDTAAAAAYVSIKKDPTIGAIASLTAAKEYSLKVAHAQVQDDSENYTRFFVIKRSNQESPLEVKIRATKAMKSSFEFIAAHKPGALLKCLEPISEYDLNLTKIESRPVLGRPFEYLFYLDVEHEARFKRYLADLIDKIQPHTQVLRHLGTYLSGERVKETLRNDQVVVVPLRYPKPKDEPEETEEADEESVEEDTATEE